MDARHPLTPLDRQLLDWFFPRRVPVHILLTKADKLSRSDAAAALRRVQRALNGTDPRCSVQLFSSKARMGVEQAQEVIAGWLGLPVRGAPHTQAARKNKNPRPKGSKAGGESALIGIKAPAQGGEAGDDETPSAK
jgi:GTP-binding protein